MKSFIIWNSCAAPDGWLAGRSHSADWAGALPQGNCYIGNDAGAMEARGGGGLRIVGVFGPADPEGTSPVTPRCAIVQQKPYCSPCFLRRCPTDHRCMT